jgi:hypothetical protein
MDTLNETKEQRKLRKSLEKIEKRNNTMSSSSVPFTVLCVRFGTRYGRDYVERLRNMVARHMTVPYEFVCLTDDNHPIEGVRSIVQPNANYARGWWHKVHMFDSSLPLAGRILYFDLDVVIHANIDKLVTMYTEDFVGIHDFNRKFHSNWVGLNSSAMAWNQGTQNHIWDLFKANPKDAQRLPGDQDWIWKTSKDKIRFWPKDWLQSYKWEIRSREELTLVDGKRRFKSTQNNITTPRDCCVTVFHGDPKPQDVQDQFVIDNWK